MSFSSLRSGLYVFVPSGRLQHALPAATALIFTSGLMVSHDRLSTPVIWALQQLESEMVLDQKWKLSGKTLGDPGKLEKEVCLLHWLEKQDGTRQADMGTRGRKLAMVSPVTPAHPSSHLVGLNKSPCSVLKYG